MIKLVEKLNETDERSLYSGKTSVNVEIYPRPAPTVDADGNAIKMSKRYLIVRLLNFQTEQRDYPFIIRYEHEYFRKDSAGKVIEVKRICCPSSKFAKSQINERIDKDYCPICNFSNKQNAEAWKNWKTTKQFDAVCQQLSKDTKARWAAYLPVLVIQDPNYKANDNHLKVLRLSGDEGRSALNQIRACIKEANDNGICVFNGGEGANIAILCERKRKLQVKKDGSPIIDSKTGEQRSYLANCITDIRLLAKRLHSYQNITEREIEKLNFDETYGTASTKDALSAFLNENYLDTGASDEDFGDDFSDSDFDKPESESNINNNAATNATSSTQSEELEDSESDFDDAPENDDSNNCVTIGDLDDEIDETPKDVIERITKGKVNSETASPKSSKVRMSTTVELPHDTETLRNESANFDECDLPF